MIKKHSYLTEWQHFLLITWATLVLSSCANQEKRKEFASKEEFDVDSISIGIINEQRSADLPEPLHISQLALIDRLDFTSGIIKKQYCDTSKNGFYGRYNLIDRKSKRELPLAGTIDIYKPGKMSDWKSSDTNQTIWSIQLTTDVISLWDSIHVGLTREEVVNFGEANQGFCVKKGDFSYACDFNNFSVAYRFQSDIVTELSVTRNCD